LSGRSPKSSISDIASIATASRPLTSTSPSAASAHVEFSTAHNLSAPHGFRAAIAAPMLPRPPHSITFGLGEK
jgi:hypothetical protein